MVDFVNSNPNPIDLNQLNTQNDNDKDEITVIFDNSVICLDSNNNNEESVKLKEEVYQNNDDIIIIESNELNDNNSLDIKSNSTSLTRQQSSCSNTNRISKRKLETTNDEPQAVAAAAPPVKKIQSIKPENLIFNYNTNNVNISVEIGDLLECDVDVIVNMSQDINLQSKCLLSQSLVKLLGSSLTNQLQLYSQLIYVPNELIYQIAVTIMHRTFENDITDLSNNMKQILFSTIYHCHLENFDYTSDKSERSYKNLLKNIFNLTKIHNFKSIAIPVYGYMKNYPASYLAKWFDDAIKEFLLSCSLSTLETIRIVVYKNDQKCIDEFKSYFNKLKNYQMNSILDLRPKNLTDSCEYQKLDINTEEYEIVFKHFKLTMPNARIFNIFKVKNHTLEEMYSASKKVLQYKNAENKSLEYKLFHGSEYKSLQSICKFGFNRSFCGKNGTVYGNGVYFARDSSYSHKFSRLNENGIFSMLLSRVLVGTFQQINSSKRVLDTDIKDDGNQYDSGVNNLNDPTIYVIYKDYRALPEYWIDYNYF